VEDLMMMNEEGRKEGRSEDRMGWAKNMIYHDA
jgi:hypothetical protein